MKKTIAILLISLMLFTSGCAVMTAAVPEPTPAPPTVEELLADALKYYNAGNYEEAILLYEAAIEIEPRNFGATVGLGKAYRSTGNNGQAVEMLKAAYELDDSPDVAFELGCAYIANGQYTDAERLASERWKDGEGDNKAGTVLLLSLAAQEKTEEVIKMLQSEDFTLFLGTGGGSGPLYMGEYDANGKRSGRGIGIYEGGYIYAGEYKDGVRYGQGTWYYPPNPYVHETTWFTGEWADDAPNGYGEQATRALTYEIWIPGSDIDNAEYEVWAQGEYVNGLENGVRIRKVIWKDELFEGHLFHYTAVNGIANYIGQSDTGGYIIAYDENKSGATFSAIRSDVKWGISPWNTDAD